MRLPRGAAPVLALLAAAAPLHALPCCHSYEGDASQDLPPSDGGGVVDGAPGNDGAPENDASWSYTCEADACPTPTTCKAIHDQTPTAPDGVYQLSSGMSVYCNMTIDTGGWMLIGNAPLAPAGTWGSNLANVLPADLSTVGRLVPADVDRLNLPYTEVLFTDTVKQSWFTVPSSSPFYLQNYGGICGSSAPVVNAPIGATACSDPTCDLYPGQITAVWPSTCGGASGEYVIPGLLPSCGLALVLFDQTCTAPADARVRAYVR
jgi:hypothetical protein